MLSAAAGLTLPAVAPAVGGFPAALRRLPFSALVADDLGGSAGSGAGRFLPLLLAAGAPDFAAAGSAAAASGSSRAASGAGSAPALARLGAAGLRRGLLLLALRLPWALAGSLRACGDLVRLWCCLGRLLWLPLR